MYRLSGNQQHQVLVRAVSDDTSNTSHQVHKTNLSLAQRLQLNNRTTIAQTNITAGKRTKRRKQTYE